MLTVTEAPIPADAVRLLTSYTDIPSPKRRLLRRAGADGTEERAAEARRLLDAGRCQAVELCHTKSPALVTHEHGLLLLTSLSGGRTHLLDVSCVGDDLRWELHATGRLARSEWRWWRLGSVGTHGFAASGAPLAVRELGDLHGSALEALLTEGDEGWPGDDAIIDVPFETLMTSPAR